MLPQGLLKLLQNSFLQDIMKYDGVLVLSMIFMGFGVQLFMEKAYLFSALFLLLSVLTTIARSVMKYKLRTDIVSDEHFERDS